MSADIYALRGQGKLASDLAHYSQFEGRLVEHGADINAKVSNFLFVHCIPQQSQRPAPTLNHVLQTGSDPQKGLQHPPAAAAEAPWQLGDHRAGTRA